MKLNTPVSLSPLSISLLVFGTILASVLASVIVSSALGPPAASEGKIPTAPIPKQMVTSGMSLLSNYKCAKAETKQIVLGGSEDNYAPGNDVPVIATELHAFVQERYSPKGAVTINRSYDDSGFDQALLDSFELPRETTSGVFVMRALSLSEMTNDSLVIGDVMSHWTERDSHGLALADVTQNPDWQKYGDIIVADLANLTLLSSSRSKAGGEAGGPRATILDFVRGSELETRKVDVLVGDDHIVDFIGFAICLPPQTDKGMSLLVRQSPIDPEFISLSCAREDGVMVCDPHAGDLKCSKQLPLACIKVDREPIAAQFRESGLDDLWTGSAVEFTEPVVGSSMKTAAAVHARCAKDFGAGYRAATSQERPFIIKYLARGEAPASGRAWVHAKTEKYANCWALDAFEAEPGG